MAAPNYSPVTGKGTVYTDPKTGESYTFDGTFWRQTSTGANIQSSDTSTQDAINRIIGSEGNVAQISYPSGVFDVTPFKDFYEKAYQELAPYYKQLLDEAKGDLNVALGNLERDYVTGKRTRIEDFTDSMNKLGITLPQEDIALQGALNKRGFALTETPGGGTEYAGGGLAKSALDTQNMDQRLRTEAVQRTRQRGLESEAIKKLTGGLTSQQSFRNTAEAQQKEHETKATSLGSQYQSAEQAEKASQIARAESGTSGGSSSNVNPDDVWSIKAAHPGYNSWNDVASIKEDYKRTGGIGK